MRPICFQPLELNFPHVSPDDVNVAPIGELPVSQYDIILSSSWIFCKVPAQTLSLLWTKSTKLHGKHLEYLKDIKLLQTKFSSDYLAAETACTSVYYMIDKQ